MAIQRKHIITGGIALVTLTGAYLYWQYNKLVDSALKFSSLKPNRVGLTNVNIDLFLKFMNHSSLQFKISEQKYKVYLNNTLLSEISKAAPQEIKANSTSMIMVNVDFNPAKIGKEIKGDAPNLLLNFSNATVRIEVNLKVHMLFFKVPIPYTYTTTIGQLMAAPKQTK